MAETETEAAERVRAETAGTSELTEIDQIRKERLGALSRRLSDLEARFDEQSSDSEGLLGAFDSLSQDLASLQAEIEKQARSGRRVRKAAYAEVINTYQAEVARLINSRAEALGCPREDLEQPFADAQGRRLCLRCERGFHFLRLHQGYRLPRVVCTVIADDFFFAGANSEDKRRAKIPEYAKGQTITDQVLFDVPRVEQCSSFQEIEGSRALLGLDKAD